MHTVYLLRSISKNWFYAGLTNNLKKRITQHNNGQTRSTKAHVPLVLVYSKDFPDRIAARDYEKFLKIRSNKEKLIQSLS